MTERKFEVATGREQAPVTGTDSTILIMPRYFYVDIEGKPTLAIQPFSRFLRDIAEKQAGDLGEVLHHAAFQITREPAVIEEVGLAGHDCESCRSSVAAAKRLVEETDDELLVGQLWWAGTT